MRRRQGGGGGGRRKRRQGGAKRKQRAERQQPEAESEESGGILDTLSRVLFGDDDEQATESRRERRRARRRGAEDADLREDRDDEDFTPADSEDLDELAERFTRKTKVRLHHRVEAYERDGAARGPVEPRVARVALPTIEQALMFYPEVVRGHMCRELHIFGKFRMRGKPFLGCAVPKKKAIHLAIHPQTKPISLKTTMHHEIAHLIEMNPRFPVKRWMAISQGQYTGKGHRDDEGKTSREELRAMGFVTKYASKNRHEDFAELAELAFTKPRKVLQFAKKHDAIARKLDIMSDVYEAIVPGLKLPWER